MKEINVCEDEWKTLYRRSYNMKKYSVRVQLEPQQMGVRREERFRESKIARKMQWCLFGRWFNS